MTTHGLRYASLALALALCGCATPAASPTPSATPTPEVKQIVVEIADMVPLDVYYNYDDVQCTAHAFSSSITRGPQVTIADGAGKILASQDGPLVGGTASVKGRCTVDVVFAGVPAADIYVVTVQSDSGEKWTRTVQNSPGDVRVDIKV